MKRKLSQGQILYGTMGEEARHSRYIGTLHPLVYQFESDEVEDKAVCYLLAFDDQLPGLWSHDKIFKITKKNRKKKYKIGDEVLIKEHRGEKIDCGAKHVFLKATIDSEEDNKCYKVKYNKKIYFPRGEKRKKLFVKRKNIYKL